MKRYFSAIIISLIGLYTFAQLSFDDTGYLTVPINAAASTGLESIYVVHNADGTRLSWLDGSVVKWSRFGSAGAAYAESIGESTSITLSHGDTGIVVETGGKSHYFWIVDYSLHPFTVSSLDIHPDQPDCQRIQLLFQGSADRLLAYSINGRPEEIDRQIKIEYTTLLYNSDTSTFVTDPVTLNFASLNPVFAIDAPLCDTRIHLYGDRFLQVWGEIESAESPLYQTTSVSVETSVDQTERTNDNEQQVTGALLGGSAPCEITFTAAVTDAASFYEWQLSNNPDFDPIDNRFSQLELNYTFRDMGTTYVRFFAADASGKCEFTSQTYEVVVGESAILCPNAFSPQSSPGVNDEWKVSYKSIVSFDCHIFNRWGIELFSTTDPAAGWDGRYKGKYVPAGTYYYVIKALGSDGRQYNLSGDINIINSKNIISSSND